MGGGIDRCPGRPIWKPGAAACEGGRVVGGEWDVALGHRGCGDKATGWAGLVADWADLLGWLARGSFFYLLVWFFLSISFLLFYLTFYLL